MEFVKIDESLWLSADGQYRITYRTEIEGVSLPPRYVACVRCVWPQQPAATYWELCTARRGYRTFSKAQESARRNRRIWERFVKLKLKLKRTPGRAEAIKTLARKATHAARWPMMTSMPAWVHAQLEDSNSKTATRKTATRKTSAGGTRAAR